MAAEGGRQGRFLVLEGIEGSGKSTQASLLAAWLERLGVPHVLVREPGGTPLGEEIRRLLLHGDAMPAVSELYLYLAARAALVDTVVRPALAAGRVVLADRFELSTLAYQGAGRGLDPATVGAANALATGGLRPDLVLLLDVPREVGEQRRAARGAADRMEQEAAAFHERVAEAYALLSDRMGPGAVRVDATGEPEVVHAAIVRLLEARFAETFPRGRG
jgi:dTMP kinase